jgi:hypothetical protein
MAAHRLHRPLHPRPVAILALLALISSLAPGMAGAQALGLSATPSGIDIVVVTLPLAEATAACWPVLVRDEFEVDCAVGGRVGFTSAMETALDEAALAPPVVVAVGGEAIDDLERLIHRLTTERPVAEAMTLTRPRVHDGALVRRLGRPGADASVSLTVALPPASQPDRSAGEVLWTLLPHLVGGEFSGFRVQLEAEVARLDFRVDSDLTDLEVRRLRLALAQLGSHQDLEGGLVREAADRLRVRRLAALESAETAAAALVRRWLLDGEAGVRQEIFAAETIVEADVRRVATEWLGRHPGAIEVTLPPRVFNPRFAPGPQIESMENNLSVAVLERPGAELVALVLRPVLLNDFTGDAATQVLARLASRIRSEPQPPAVVTVAENPPRLELAGPSGAFADLTEALQRGLEALQGDEAVVETPDTARSRALGLMAGRLGLAAVERTTASDLLRPDNLAVGGLVEDAGPALEAFRKFGVGGPLRRDATVVQPLPPEMVKSRQVSPGSLAALVILVDLPSDPVHASTMAALLSRRLGQSLPDARIELLRPLVPGRRVALLVVEVEGDLPTLEAAVAEAWPTAAETPTDDEVAAVGRQLGTTVAAEAGGVLGRARLCAGVAAGDTFWRAPAETEMALLLLDAEQLSIPMSMIPPWEETLSTGAGRLPLVTP